MFFPSPDGVRDVLRRARARKRRRALLTSGGFAAVAAVTGILIGAAGTGTGADRLGVVPTAPDHHGARPAPGSTGPAARSQPTTPSTVGAAGSGTVLPGAPGPTAPRNTFPVSRPSSSPTPTAPPKRQSANAPITRTTVGYDSACDPTYDVQGWCELYTGPTQARRKHPVALSVELCRPSVVGDGTVHFTNTREISFELDDANGTKVWAAGQGLTYKNATYALVVKGGTCVRWTSSWDTIAADGFYAPPGTYTYNFGLESSDVTTGTGGDALTLTD